MSTVGTARGAPELVAASTAAEALAICAQIERGHGRGTLAARFEQLKSVGAGAEPVVLAVALSEGALRALAAWMLMLDGREAVVLPATQRLIIASSRDAGYALSLPVGGRKALRDAAALQLELKALAQRAEPIGGGVTIEVPRGAERWTRIELLAAPLSADGFRTETLAAALAEGAAMLLVAGAEDHALASPARETLRDVLGILPVLQPLVTPAEAARKPARPWWEDPMLARAPLRLPPAVLQQSASLPVFALPPQPAAKGAAAVTLLRALQAALESLGGALARETARQRALKGREDRVLRTLEARPMGGGERDVQERVRLRLDEGIARIERQIEDQNRRALLPNGNLNMAVGEMLRSLSLQELEQTEAYNEIKVTIRGEFASRLLDTAKKEIRNQFKDDVYQIKTGTEACREALVAELGKATGSVPTLAVPHADENEIWRSLREALSLQLAYHGTVPKRGFWQRLAEGKQLMFTMLSLLGLGGMVFGFSRSEIGPLIALGLPVVFFIGVGLTFWNWKEEDAARLGKELERIRDQVSSEVKRLIGEIQREKMMRLKDALEAIRKDLSRRVDGVLKEHSAASAEQASRARNEGRDRQRAIDLRVRELQPLGLQLSRLQQGCSEALRDAQETLRAQAKPGGSA